MRCGRGPESGMTLVEVLVAMGVLVIGMSAILALFNTAVFIQKTAAERNDVSTLASGVLARVRDDLSGRLAEGGREALGAGVILPVPGHPRYHYRVEVDDDPSDPDGRAIFCHIEILAKRRGEWVPYDLGYFPVIPEANNDERIRRLLGG